MSTVSTVWAEALWLLLVALAAIICGVWLIDRKHVYLVFVGTAPVGFVVAMLIEHSPLDAAYRVAISAAFLISGVYCGLEGLTRRTGRGPGSYSVEVTAVLGLAGLLALAATHRSLTWEVRIQDCTAALMICISVFGCGRFLANGRRGDRFLGLQILAFGGYFLTRSWVGLDGAALSTTTRWGFDSFTPPFVIAFVLLSALIAGTITVQELAIVVETLRHERDTDMLTGVLNRRGFQARVEHLLTVRGHLSSSLVVCDLDNFKPINDRYGHIAGDEVLRDFCVLLRASVRTSDVLGRIGGDEFAVYLTGSTQRDAVEFSEGIRCDLSRSQFRALADTDSVTASFGVATTIAGMEFIDLVFAADNQLYQAKEGRPKSRAAAFGRNGLPTDITGDRAPHSDSIRSRWTA